MEAGSQRTKFAGASVSLARASVRRGERTILRDVSFDVAPGELIVLIGPSGSGKSTLLSTLNRLVELDQGTAHIDGTEIRSLPPHELRRKVGYCFQAVGLFPHMTVAENVGITPRLLGWEASRIRARVEDLLATVGLDETFAQRLPHQLSGGQAQRVALARALAASPPLLLLDEPFAGLDPDTRVRMQEELLTLRRALGVTTVLVSHDLAEAIALASRVLVLMDGELVEDAMIPDLLARPATAKVRALLEPALRRARMVVAADEQSGVASSRGDAP